MNLELLVAKREGMGFTQEKMAKLLGYKSKGSYCLIENGKVKITLDIAKSIKNILQLTNKEFNTIFFTEEVQENKTCKVI